MKKAIREILPYLIIVIVVILIKTWIVTPVRVNGSSMYPTLHEKDIMLLNKVSYRFNDIKRFDIVVVDVEGTYLIKRVIGLPGEHIVYKNNTLYVNGKKTKEVVKNLETKDFDSKTLGDEKIQEGNYFVLGDNRNNSMDSREIGMISEKQILGKTSFVLFPFDRFGTKK